jgi:hypothetical protein
MEECKGELPQYPSYWPTFPSLLHVLPYPLEHFYVAFATMIMASLELTS